MLFLEQTKNNGYRQEMHAIWRDKGTFNIAEQKLVNQKSQIRKNLWLTKLELEEIQRRIEDEVHGVVQNDSESEDEQWLLGFDEKRWRCISERSYRVVLEIGNQHENNDFGFRIKKNS